MASESQDMRLLELARERGLITESQMEELRREHAASRQQGRSKSPTRMAIDKGVLSDEDTRDLETAAWIQELPPQLGDYQLVRMLGRGGMAVVFEARDVSLGKVVALKVLLPEFASSEAYLARFHREARIAAKLTHPNTVQVFRAGEEGKLHYLVMEYVEGEPLSAVIKRRGRIPAPEALDIVMKVCGALQEAAGMGIVHRDIKPGNILVSKWGVPKLADFGIAKEFGDIRDPRIMQSLTMGVVGTPTYMSPEQARGSRDLDLRTDIYSLGATLYHMVVGDLPFFAHTPQETMVRVVSGQPRPPCSACPELSEGAGAVICRMMAKDPANRHADFEELAEDMVAARDGAEVSMGYREAVRLLAPAEEDAGHREEAEPASMLRIVAVAVGFAVMALTLLLLTKSCG